MCSSDLGIPGAAGASKELSDIAYTRVVSLDLGSVAPSLAGPKRPQDRIELGHVKDQFASLFSKPPAENGFNQPAAHLHTRHVVRAADVADAAPPQAPAAAPGAVVRTRGWASIRRAPPPRAPGGGCASSPPGG